MVGRLSVCGGAAGGGLEPEAAGGSMAGDGAFDELCFDVAGGINCDRLDPVPGFPQGAAFFASIGFMGRISLSVLELPG